MRLLLDENLPKHLKEDFPDHEVYTVREKGWNGMKNGALLQLLVQDAFDALLTFDKNLQHQQNFAKSPITVFVLTASTNQYNALTRLTPAINRLLNTAGLPDGPIIISKE